MDSFKNFNQKDQTVIDKAITVDPVRNDRTGKHAILAPVVHSDHCTGCGICERACVTKKAAIFVLPLRLAKGESSDRDVRGWEAGGETHRGRARKYDHRNAQERKEPDRVSEPGGPVAWGASGRTGTAFCGE